MQQTREQKKWVTFTIEEHTLSSSFAKAQEYYARYQVPEPQQGLVPAIFVNEQFFIGFNKQIGEQIAALLLPPDNADTQLEQKSSENKITLPRIGEVDILSYSLPILSLVLWIIDGFNVCSLSALIMILSLVLVLRSRKRIIFLWWIFLLTTGLVYGVLIFLWHRLFGLIMPYITHVEMFIGILSILGGIYLLREFFIAYKQWPICSSNNLLSRIAPKINKIFQEKTNRFILGGVVFLFALVITLVEFPCSAVIPGMFTATLVWAGITGVGETLPYLVLFLLMYLLDEVIIFAIAVATLQLKIVSPKWIIFFNLLAACIFIGLGIYYLW